MKTMKKKGGIFAALTAVLLAAALVIGCFVPMEGVLPGSEDQTFPLAEGMGAVQLTFSEAGGVRTIFPTKPANFDTYRVVFIGDTLHLTNPTVNHPTGSPGYLTITRVASENYSIADVPVGEYLKITIEAYVGTTLVATGEYDTPFEIKSGQTNAAVTIALDWLKTSGTGTLTYNFGGTTLLNLAEMAIANRSTSTPITGSPFDIEGTPSDSTGTSLAPGAYDVTFTLQNATYPGTIIVREVLYIYGGLPTHYAFTFLPDLFPKPPSPGGQNLIFTIPNMPDGVLAFTAPVISDPDDVKYYAVGAVTAGSELPAFVNGCVVQMEDAATFALTIPGATAALECWSQVDGDLLGQVVGGTLEIEAGDGLFTFVKNLSGTDYDVPYYLVQIFDDVGTAPDTEVYGLYFYVIKAP